MRGSEVIPAKVFDDEESEVMYLENEEMRKRHLSDVQPRVIHSRASESFQ